MKKYEKEKEEAVADGAQRAKAAGENNNAGTNREQGTEKALHCIC